MPTRSLIAVAAASYLVVSATAVDDTWSLAPLGNCSAASVCYQGPVNALNLVKKIDPRVCQYTLLRPGNCSLYAFPALKGAQPFLPEVTTYTPSPGPHLWFRLWNPLRQRCGEVDAADRMPASIFAPGNKLALAAYIVATNAGWGTESGRCADLVKPVQDAGKNAGVAPYSQYAGFLRTVSWSFGSAQAKICKARCNCSLEGAFAATKCYDVPDQPLQGKFCSLCGPTFNRLVRVTLYVQPSPPPPPPAPTPPGGKTIVELAVATPDLSTLVTALTAAGLVGTLNGVGPFTVFAPTNEAFAALPAGTVANLLKPENKAQLVDILTYHVVSGSVLAKDLSDGEMIATVEGKSVEARVSGNDIFINSARVMTADIAATNGVVHVIDRVLLPPASN